MPGPRILTATTNPAKAERLHRCLGGWPFEFFGPEDLPGVRPPEESAASHREIAGDKAVYWSKAAKGLAIASDGGLIIPALRERWSSLTTKRATGGEDATDEARIQRLLTLMVPHQGEERRALWREAVALADDGRLIEVWEVEGPVGYIAPAPSPARIAGFWAASLWYFPQADKTYTELSAEELRQLRDPWTRLTEAIQGWLQQGGWERLERTSSTGNV